MIEVGNKIKLSEEFFTQNQEIVSSFEELTVLEEYEVLKVSDTSYGAIGVVAMSDSTGKIFDILDANDGESYWWCFVSSEFPNEYEVL